MTKQKGATFRRWLRVAFVSWATFAMLWLANSMRTRGVPEETLQSDRAVSVVSNATQLAFLPLSAPRNRGLLFICGSGVAAEAYGPLLRPIAEAGFPVHVVRLPYRFAPLDSHKKQALERVRAVMASEPAVKAWVVAGHSLGGALAARMARNEAESISALVLIGTTHPKDFDLSSLRIPVTKVYASNDGIAPVDRVMANRALLPKQTRWVEIRGGNHSQFGRYGHQLFDGKATIPRGEQEATTRRVLLESLDLTP